jgi:hypothetical protein
MNLGLTDVTTLNLGLQGVTKAYLGLVEVLAGDPKVKFLFQANESIVPVFGPPFASFDRASDAYADGPGGPIFVVDLPRIMSGQGLLLEPEAINDISRSMLGWTLAGVVTNMAAVSAGAPDGSDSYEWSYVSGGPGAGVLRLIPTMPDSSQRTFSIYVKNNGAGTRSINFFIEYEGGDVGASHDLEPGVWTRISYSYIVPKMANDFLIELTFEFDDSVTTYGPLEFWQPQVETGDLATSPIIDSGYRAEDICQLDIPSGVTELYLYRTDLAGNNAEGVDGVTGPTVYNLPSGFIYQAVSDRSIV